MSISKPVFYKELSEKCCHSLLHPWHPTCITASAILMKESLFASSKFFALAYIAQLAMKGTSNIKQQNRCFIRATLHGVFSSFTFIFSNCLFRKLFNKFNYYWVGLGSGTVCGLGIFLEHPSRRKLLTLTYLNLVLEVCVYILENKGLFKKSTLYRTLLFMLINSGLVYKLTTDDFARKNSLWFFIPPKKRVEVTNKNQNASHCSHDNVCWKHIAKNVAIFFTLGIVLQCTRELVFTKKLPALQWDFIKLGLFASSYVGVYKIICCGLCNLRGHDASIHSLPAGFAAGMSFLFYPNLTLLISAFSNLLMILAHHIKESHGLPDFPYKEIAFTICSGILYHSRIMHAHVCPKFFILIANTITNHKTQLLYTILKEEIKKSDQSIFK